AINELRCVTLHFQIFAYGAQMIVIGPAHNGLARNWRRTQRQGFEPAYGSGAGGEHALELQSLTGQLIESGRQILGIAIRPKVAGRKAFHGNQYYILRTLDKWPLHIPAVTVFHLNEAHV